MNIYLNSKLRRFQSMPNIIGNSFDNNNIHLLSRRKKTNIILYIETMSNQLADSNHVSARLVYKMIFFKSVENIWNAKKIQYVSLGSDKKIKTGEFEPSETFLNVTISNVVI